MTIQQFHQLNEMEKVSIIMQCGRLMAQNMEENARIFLYRVESFYVSASYSKSNDQLTDITAYLNIDQSIPQFRKFLISIHPAEREYETPQL